MPETPLLMAGLVGGPLCIGSLTPFRNCLALASQDSASSFTQIWGRVLGSGIRGAYAGALAPIPSSVIQFTAVGPLFHVFSSLVGPTAGVAMSAAAETVIIFGPEGRNVQMAFNHSVGAEKQVALRSYLKPWGPGVLALYGRNLVANSGIRVLSDPMANVYRSVLGAAGVKPSDTSAKVAGDFISSIITGGCSMPFNQTFYFCSTSRAVQESTSASVKKDLILKFLRKQYITESGGISRNMLRDVSIRAFYIGSLFSMFAAVERTAISLYR